jgi:signal transduction histidine kinase
MGYPLSLQVGNLGSLATANELWGDSQATASNAPRMTMREVVASIAHEVNQPLAAIVANAESCLSWLSADQPDMARARKAAERIVRDGHHASDVLNGIRALLKSAAPAMLPLDLNEVVRDILDPMRADLSEKQVVLHIELTSQLGYVRGNRTQLQQVLLNLVKNAVESMCSEAPRPLLVRLSTAIQGGSAVLAVEDSGSGFDGAAAARMFEPFFTTKVQGTGVGLSICRSIVEAHGGVIWATPKTPHGSVFQFTVPFIGQPGSTDKQGGMDLLV